MALPTAFTDLFAIAHQIALAPMGGPSGSALAAAAVSNGGGLGLVGGSRNGEDWCRRELTAVAGLTDRPWGVGFLTWALTPAALDAALGHGPAAVVLSFGDPAAFADQVCAAAARLIVQVTNLDEARQALDAGADVVVAQGSEAGIARGAPWPADYTARTLRNPFLDEWRGREDELAGAHDAHRAYAEAAAAGDLTVVPVWAGEAIDLIDDVPSAADLVPGMVAEAEAAIAGASPRP